MLLPGWPTLTGGVTSGVWVVLGQRQGQTLSDTASSFIKHRFVAIGDLGPLPKAHVNTPKHVEPHSLSPSAGRPFVPKKFIFCLSELECI